MTLAIILLFSASCLTAGQSTAQSASTSDSPTVKTQDSAQQVQTPPTSSPAAASPSSTPSQASSDPKPSAAKRPHHKKKIAAVKCSDVPVAATGSASITPADAAGTNTTAASAPTNCPPSITIVRQGGTSEPSIQLEGGEGGDQAAYQKNSANQILATTQHNLNQLAGRRLDENQKNMLNQVHEFMQQAKNAVSGGDLDRARTLAWKAQLLSEELIKPEN